MKAVRKFSTFDDLKSCENKTEKLESSLKKHNAFEKVILEIRSNKNKQVSKAKPKS
jgi:hypothetical protein